MNTASQQKLFSQKPEWGAMPPSAVPLTSPSFHAPGVTAHQNYDKLQAPTEADRGITSTGQLSVVRFLKSKLTIPFLVISVTILAVAVVATVIAFFKMRSRKTKNGQHVFSGARGSEEHDLLDRKNPAENVRNPSIPDTPVAIPDTPVSPDREILPRESPRHSSNLHASGRADEEDQQEQHMELPNAITIAKRLLRADKMTEEKSQAHKNKSNPRSDEKNTDIQKRKQPKKTGALSKEDIQLTAKYLDAMNDSENEIGVLRSRTPQNENVRCTDKEKTTIKKADIHVELRESPVHLNRRNRNSDEEEYTRSSHRTGAASSESQREFSENETVSECGEPTASDVSEDDESEYDETTTAEESDRENEYNHDHYE